MNFRSFRGEQTTNEVHRPRRLANQMTLNSRITSRFSDLPLRTSLAVARCTANIHRVFLIAVVAVMSVTISSFGVEIFDSFDDGDQSDGMPANWVYSGSRSRVENGDLIIGNPRGDSDLHAATLDVPPITTGWSMQARVRLHEGYYFGFMDDAGWTGTEFSNGWSMLDGGGGLSLGATFFKRGTEFSDVRPATEDVLIQLDTFGYQFRAWVWRPGEQRPDEPLIERRIRLFRPSKPKVWTRFPSGAPTDVRFRWVHVSSERSLPSPQVGDFDHDGTIGVADIDLLSAQIRTGEDYPDFDLTNDTLVDAADLTELVTGPMNTWLGDANLDGQFDSGDLVEVFKANEYEDDVLLNSTWSTGDWNGDGEFDSGDLIAAFQENGYEQGTRVATAAVPEPSFAILSVGLLGVAGLLRRRHLHT